MSTVKVQSISGGFNSDTLFLSLRVVGNKSECSVYSKRFLSFLLFCPLPFLCTPCLYILEGSSLILLLSASNLSCDYLVMIYGKELMGGCRVSWWLWFPIFEIALPMNVGLLKFILFIQFLLTPANGFFLTLLLHH